MIYVITYFFLSETLLLLRLQICPDNTAVYSMLIESHYPFLHHVHSHHTWLFLYPEYPSFPIQPFFSLWGIVSRRSMVTNLLTLHPHTSRTSYTRCICNEMKGYKYEHWNVFGRFIINALPPAWYAVLMAFTWQWKFMCEATCSCQAVQGSASPFYFDFCLSPC